MSREGKRAAVRQLLQEHILKVQAEQGLSPIDMTYLLAQLTMVWMGNIASRQPSEESMEAARQSILGILSEDEPAEESHPHWCAHTFPHPGINCSVIHKAFGCACNEGRKPT